MSSKMARNVLLITLIGLAISSGHGLRSTLFKGHKAKCPEGLCGEPLFLTPLIQAGQLDQARQVSRVTGLPNAPEVESYAGYLTVNEEYDSNMFFWFFPAADAKAPILLWLQGGPGGTSMFGLFVENGPLQILANNSAILREYGWSRKYSTVYIDNPVGTGFSFTKHDAGYATNQTDVASDLFEALQQFFTLFHEYQANDFYVTGESYAGKYVPAIAYKIHTEGKNAKMSLKGISIGDGLCDPETQGDYASFLYQVGLLDENQRDKMAAEQVKAIRYIQRGQFYDAFVIFDTILNGDLISGKTLFFNATGMTYYFNLLSTNQPEDMGYFNDYLQLPETRNAIHVGNLTFNDGRIVEEHLVNDIMQSIKPWLAVLMDNYKVLMYSGQLDIIVAAPLTENFLHNVRWSGQDEYLKTAKQVWKVDPSDRDVAGYVRHVRDFYHVIVRNGGHMLPYDQPRRSFYMIDNFINDSF
ncbi:putative serine carboxypeptidase CPVL [Halotydeus destructor]|nr:putative serine carboxypeptidase CPVL [Halotydeus destructor]